MPTRIGALRLRHDRATDAAAFLSIGEARGRELWRVFLPNVALRDDVDDSIATLLRTEEVAELDDVELDRTADAYLDAVLATDDQAFAQALPREQDERSSDYAARLLEALYSARPERLETTIDRLSTVVAPLGDAKAEGRASGGEPSPRQEIAKEVLGGLRPREDAVADAQKRVEEIQTLLVTREAERQRAHESDASSDPSDAIVVVASNADAPIEDDGGAQDSGSAREGDASMLDRAAAANHKTAERLGDLAQALNAAVAALDEGRQRSETLVRRGVVTSVALLALSCALIAANLAQDYYDSRGLRAYEESARTQVAAQQELRQEIARLRDERASLAARIAQLESESARAVETAKPPVEVVQAPEPARVAEAVRPVKASKSSRSRQSKSAAAR